MVKEAAGAGIDAGGEREPSLGQSIQDGDSGGTDAAAPRVALKRELNLLHGVSLIVGCVIGSGIFISPVGILRNVHSIGAALMIWLVEGIFCTLCALCYAELGTTYPASGGDYLYVREAFGSFAGFLVFWTEFMFFGIVPNVASSLIFATYILQPLFQGCTPPPAAVQMVAALVYTLLIGINCQNVKWAAKTQVVFTVMKLLALGVIICIGGYYLATGHTQNLDDAFSGSNGNPGSIVMAFYAGYWSFGGWNYLNMVVGEMKRPERTLPMSIVIGIGIITSVYLLANVAYAGVLSASDMILSPAVAFTFAQKAMGPAWPIMPVLVALSIFGGMNGGTMGVSRIPHAAGERGEFPAIVSMISCQHLTPSPSLILIGFLVIVLQFFNDIFYMIEMLGFVSTAILAVVFAGLIILRLRFPRKHRPVKMPLVIPAVMLALTSCICGITVYQAPRTCGVAVGLAAIGIPLYIGGVVWTSKPKALMAYYSTFTSVIQKILLVVPQDKDESTKKEFAEL